MQKLIMPVNQAIISASFKNPSYKKKFGFDHYGVDMYSKECDIIWGQGIGIALAYGWDNLYGWYASILYPEAYYNNHPKSIIANYFHMREKQILPTIITTNTVIGRIGETGQYATGPHLHLEMYPTKDFISSGGHIMSPFNSPTFRKCDTAFDPLLITFLKPTHPDLQTIEFENSVYINSANKNMVKEL